MGATIFETNITYHYRSNITSNTMTRKQLFLLSSSVLLLFSCRPEVEVDTLYFLEGTWTEMAGRPQETWEVTNTGMKGVGFAIEEGDTMVYEEMELLSKKGVIIYAVKPEDRDSTLYFPLTRHTENEWTFENPYNDFPSSITYRKNSNAQMVVILQGNQREVRFLFDKEVN